MGYASLRREVRYGRNSRIDVLLEAPDRAPCLVEVKNVTMKRGALGPGAVEFPDSVTERGTKHLHELADAVNQGSRAVMLFLAQRQDGERLTLAQDIDPAYAQALGHARAAGVEAFCYRCAVTPTGIEVTDRIDVILPSPAGA
jgi:sugar fermentation stimulation protein A